ncbi:MAG: hypothetical protein ACRDS0_05345 [Pseudonocardiaceae bacterium]
MSVELTGGDAGAVWRTGLPLVDAGVLGTAELRRPVSAGEPPPNAAAAAPPSSDGTLLVGLNHA